MTIKTFNDNGFNRAVCKQYNDIDDEFVVTAEAIVTSDEWVEIEFDNSLEYNEADLRELSEFFTLLADELNRRKYN